MPFPFSGRMNPEAVSREADDHRCHPVHDAAAPCCPRVHLSTLPESLVRTGLERDLEVQTACPPVHVKVNSNVMSKSISFLFPLKVFPTQKACTYSGVRNGGTGGWCTQILVHSKRKGLRMLIYKGLKGVTERTKFLGYTQSTLKPICRAEEPSQRSGLGIRECFLLTENDQRG